MFLSFLADSRWGKLVLQFPVRLKLIEINNSQFHVNLCARYINESVRSVLHEYKLIVDPDMKIYFAIFV